MKSRLQKLMAEANVASRRAAERLIEQGRVRVNGNLATLGDKADPETDVIEVDGERLKLGSQQKKLYFALYKPKQVLTTSAPHRGDERETVLDLLPYKGHLFTIGRLDADSEGLVVLTNDGDLTHRLTHPRYRHTKTYKVTVRGLPSEAVLQRWEEGVWLEEEGTSSKTAPCLVSIVKGSPRETVLRITMIEGKKRQIRRVAMALGHPVERLVRTHIGMLSVEGLRPGEWRELTPREVHELSTPSPALKELRSRKQERRADRGSQPRGEARDTEERPRRRAFGEGNRDQARSQRPHYRSDDDNTRTDERNPRRSAKPSNYQDRQRRSLIDSDEERPRRSSFQRDENSRSEERPRRSASQSSNYQGKPRRSFGEETKSEERPRRSRFQRDDDTRSDSRFSRSRFDDAGQNEERPRRPRFQTDENMRSDERPRRSASPNYQDRPRRPVVDNDDERPRRPRYRSDDNETRTDERNPRRSSKPSNFQNRQQRSFDEQAQGDEEQRAPRFQRDENTRSGERPDRPRRRSEDASRDSNRSRPSNRASGSRARDDGRRSSGNRSQRNNKRSTGRSSDNRRPSSQNKQRGRQGRDNE